jgi:hypothetical protein
MDDRLYFDCERDANGRPVRPLQRQREKAHQCVFCGAEESEDCRIPLCEDGQLSCARELDKRLSECGLSEENIADGNARALRTARDREGEAIDTPLREDGLSRFYRFRSWRERNSHKKKIPQWFKKRNKASDLAELTVLTWQHGNILMSPRKARHAMRSWLRMHLKWDTNKKMEGKRARGLTAIRVDLDRLRKTGRKLHVLLRWFVKQPGDVMGG